MNNLKKKLKNFGQLEVLVFSSVFYVVAMLIWTASTRNEILNKADNIKYNHKSVVEFLNNEINKCSQDFQKNQLYFEQFLLPF